MPFMIIKEIRPVIPGEVAEGIGGVATVAGMLTKIDDFCFVATSGMYAPLLHDVVIGRVYSNNSDFYKLDIGGTSCVLQALAFRNVTKRNKPEININDWVLCKITRLGTECLVSCAWDGLGKLSGGHVVQIGQWKVRRLLISKWLREQGCIYKFKVAVGMNGFVWVGSEDTSTVAKMISGILFNV